MSKSDDLISRQAAIDAVEHVTWYHQNAKGEMVRGANSAEHQPWYKADDIYKALEEVTSAEPEQRWMPVAEFPPRGKDLMLKIYDRRNSFYYYHMGFYDGKKYYTYNFSWWEDKDLEIVGWRLCLWEGEKE